MQENYDITYKNLKKGLIFDIRISVKESTKENFVSLDTKTGKIVKGKTKSNFYPHVIELLALDLFRLENAGFSLKNFQSIFAKIKTKPDAALAGKKRNKLNYSINHIETFDMSVELVMGIANHEIETFEDLDDEKIILLQIMSKVFDQI
jgi:uncharacterized protein YwbE